jgi:hypothetical protein
MKHNKSQEDCSKRHIVFGDSDDDKRKHNNNPHDVIREDIHKRLKRIHQLIHLFQERSRKVVGEKFI